MKLSENFTLDELTKSQEAIRLGIENTLKMNNNKFNFAL
jgi:hypothetical protein